MTRFILGHLSDVHLTPPPGGSVADLFSKRAFSRLSWARARRHEHRMEVTRALTDDIRAQGVDHLAITGDLINFAAPEEFPAARDWLESLGDPRDATVSLGNHDLLVKPPSPGGPELWDPWMGDEPGPPRFPTVRERGAVALVNLCSSLPTPVFSAAGEVGEAQRARLEQALSGLGARGLFRVVLIHHPVADGVVSRRKALRDAAEVRAVLSRAGAELVLHGHGHEAAVSSVAGPDGPIPVLGVPSASAAQVGHHAPARWRRIEIEDALQRGHVTVRERGIGPEGLQVRELGGYRLTTPRRSLLAHSA